MGIKITEGINDVHAKLVLQSGGFLGQYYLQASASGDNAHEAMINFKLQLENLASRLGEEIIRYERDTQTNRG